MYASGRTIWPYDDDQEDGSIAELQARNGHLTSVFDDIYRSNSWACVLNLPAYMYLTYLPVLSSPDVYL